MSDRKTDGQISSSLEVMMELHKGATEFQKVSAELHGEVARFTLLNIHLITFILEKLVKIDERIEKLESKYHFNSREGSKNFRKKRRKKRSEAE